MPVELIPGDLTDTAALDRLVSGADAVVHMGGVIKARDRDGFMRINRDATEMLAKKWRAKAPAARFVLLSSLAAREPHLSHYAASKHAAEDVLDQVAPTAPHILRPTAIYGEGDRETLAVFKAAAMRVHPMLGLPGSKLTLVHAGDVARAVIACLNGAPAGRYEVTDRQNSGYDWEDVIGGACVAVGTTRRAFRLPASVLRLIGRAGDLGAGVTGSAEMVTSQKVREILHPDWSSDRENQLPERCWSPKVDLSTGFSKTVAWYRSAGWLA